MTFDQSFLSTDEATLCKHVEHCFYEGARFVGSAGEQVQVIAKGEWHKQGAPDIANIALLINGQLHVGNAEFHKRTSDWFAHKHQDNPAYQTLVAHIVCKHDTEQSTGARATIVIDDAMIRAGEQCADEQRASIAQSAIPSSTVNALMVAQYAVARLERKAQEFLPLAMQYRGQTRVMLHAGIAQFAERLAHKRTRTTGVASALEIVLHDEKATALIAHIMDELLHEEAMLLRIEGLLHTYISHGGTMEIMTNVIAPLLLVHLPVYAQDRVWAWWWAAQAVNAYTSLAKRFPHAPQRYVWQQQGLLEMVQAPSGGTGQRVMETAPSYS
jgi:hypothetical protein